MSTTESTLLKSKVDDISKSLLDLVSSLVTQIGDSLPSAQIRLFIKAYEQLYFYLKTNQMGPLLTLPLQRTADYLITREL